MADIWFISDTHFFHDNIIHYCNRPFKNSTVMNEKLIENWNAIVKPNDKIYHLGDVGMACTDQELHNLLKKLNGHKRLILGNHDNPKSPALQNNFEKIMLWNGFHAERIFTVSHIPLPLEHLRDGKYCVHGHIHDNVSSNPYYINVCVEQTGYRPIHIDTICEMINARDKNTNTRYLPSGGPGRELADK